VPAVGGITRRESYPFESTPPFGTSVGANVEEARAACSRPDFANKIAIALKEARETRFWLRVLIDAECIDRALLEPLLGEATEIMKVLGAISTKVRRDPS
jgi:four helix bundle protein